MENKNVKLVPPWIEYKNKVVALFGKDPQIKIEYNDDAKELKMFVNSARKAEAIGKLLPGGITFGNVTMDIKVIPANSEETIHDIMDSCFLRRQ